MVDLRWNGFVASLILLAVPLFSVDVDTEELDTISDTSVEFINYEGPHDRIDTREEIIGIGRSLASSLSGDRDTATYAGKYRLAHVVDPGGGTGLDADILYLLPGSEVDHIVNVRRILAGYLERAYDYSLNDALLLAEFVTIYNAVYRGRLEYFSQSYKAMVLEYLSSDGVGIATVYREWPGNTELVIPLSEEAAEGGLGSLDSDVLTEEEVVDELRKQEDRGIPSRKDMTELKEREVEEEQQEIDEERREVEESRERIEEEREVIEEEQRAVEEEKRAAEEAEDGERLAAASEREEELEQREAQLEEEEEALEEQEEELEEREEEQAERVERIQQEREEIASEEREMLEEEEPSGPTTGTEDVSSAEEVSRRVLFLKGFSDPDTGGRFSSIVAVDVGTGTVVAESATNAIRGRRFYEFSEGLLVVAGERAANRSVRLVLLDPVTLDQTVTGDTPLHPESWIALEEEGTVLAVVERENEWRIGRFDEELELIRDSSVAVDPGTVITSVEGVIYIQDESGAVVALDEDALGLVREVE